MESSLAIRLRSDERVIELKADFQIAVRLLQSQKKKKKSVTGEQIMKILRKKRRNWLKKCFQRLKMIMPERRTEEEN